MTWRPGRLSGIKSAEMPISSRLVISSAVIFLLVGLVALLSIVGMTVWLGERSQVSFDRVSEARDARGAAVELNADLQTAESSQRGFLLTGNEIYLAPYDTAKSAALRQVAALGQLLQAYPDSQVPLQRLTGLVGDKLSELDETITLKRAQHDDEAMAIVTTNKGKTLTDEINVFVSGLVRQADDRLNAAIAEQRDNANWLRGVAAGAAILIVLVVGGAAFVLLRYTRELRRTQRELNVLNEGLERRVDERTADLKAARDRAQVLLSEVNHRVANSLALVSSLVSLQGKAVKDQVAKTALAETQDRIFAVSLVHKRLYSANDVRVVTLDEYLTGLLEHLKSSLRSEGQGVTLTYALEPVQLPTDASVNLGVVVTEWVTNAFKYAYPDGAGEIRVKLRALPEEMVELLVEDDGVGKAEGVPAQGTGLGTRIVTAMAASLSATIEYLRRQPGTTARLLFSARARTPAQSPAE